MKKRFATPLNIQILLIPIKSNMKFKLVILVFSLLVSSIIYSQDITSNKDISNDNQTFRYLSVLYTYSFNPGITYALIPDLSIENYSGFNIEAAWVPSKWGIGFGYQWINSKKGESQNPFDGTRVTAQQTYDIFYADLQYYLLDQTKKVNIFLFGGGAYVKNVIETTGDSGFDNGGVSIGSLGDSKSNEFGYSFGIGLIYKFIYLNGRVGSDQTTVNAGFIYKW